MKYGDRLKAARQYAKLSQATLAELVKISQANISKLEVGEATGSEYTVQIAMACNVSPEWLATGVGSMEKNTYELPPVLREHIKVMEQLPDYAQTEVIQTAIKTVELIHKAQAATKHNGTTQ